MADDSMTAVEGWKGKQEVWHTHTLSSLSKSIGVAAGRKGPWFDYGCYVFHHPKKRGLSRFFFFFLLSFFVFLTRSTLRYDLLSLFSAPDSFAHEIRLICALLGTCYDDIVARNLDIYTNAHNHIEIGEMELKKKLNTTCSGTQNAYIQGLGLDISENPAVVQFG